MLGWLKKKLILRQLRKLLEGENMGFLKGIISSKKLGAAIAGILTIVATQVLDLDPAFAEKVVTIIMTYIGGQSVVDLGLALKGAKSE